MGLLFLIGWVAGQIVRLPGDLPVTLLDVAVGGAIISELAKICSFAVTLRKTQGKPTLPTSSGSGWPRAAASSHRKFADFANKKKVGLYITIIIATSWILGLRLFSWQESIFGGLYLLRFLGYLWVIANADKLLAPVKKFIAPALWVFVILAWVQYLFLPDTRFLLQYGWDEHYYRMIGTVLDPNYLGVMLGVIGISGGIGAIGGIRGKWLGAVALAGLVVTYSRASWAAVMVVGCWLLAPPRGSARRVISGGFRGRLGKLGGLGILGVIGLIGIWFVVPKPGGEGVNLFRTNSIEQRIVSWREGIDVWWEHPWVGVGFNNYAVYKAHGNSKIVTGLNGIDHAGNAPSSSWILLLATTGVIGIGGLWVIGVIGGIREMAKNKLWIGVLVMVGIHAIFNNTFFYPSVLGLLALIKAASED